MEPPIGPPIEPPARPPVEPPVRPPAEPPVNPPIEPPVRPPVEPPIGPPIEPPPARRTKRARTYVGKDGDVSDSGGGGGSPAERKEIEEKAIRVVVAYEKLYQREVDVKPPNHEGYDIESFELDPVMQILGRDDQKKLVRYIEVKGTKHPWDDYGVYLTPPEFRHAQEKGDKYFLYVVEYVLHPEHTKLYIVKNPIAHIDEYRFDGGWQEIAEDVIEVVQLSMETDELKDADSEPVTD